MSSNAIETMMGAVVLAVAGGFLYFAYDKSSIKPIDGYTLTASFSSISGVAPGTAVRVSGIKVGVVEALQLDPETYQAVATLRVEDAIKLPKDSSAAVQSTGLIGEKFLALEPGADESMLKNGEKIEYTQSSVSIEEMIGKFVFSGGGADKGGKPGESAPKAAADLPTLE